MPTRIDHCPPCTLGRLESPPNGQGLDLDDQLVLNALSGGQVLDIAQARRQGVRSEDILAARGCAALIHDGQCPLYRELEALNSSTPHLIKKI